MSPLEFEAKISIPADSQAWADLLPELPLHATLLEADLWIRPDRLSMVLVYRGARSNGVINQRRSRQRISLSHRQARDLIAKAYPGNYRAEVLSSVITTSEVDMSTISPEAQVLGFVSSTGKMHLIGDVDPDSTYVQTACSSAYSHGERATFAIKDLTCQKCRKIAGLEDAVVNPE